MTIDRVQIGPCTLYRGDCREVLPTLDTQSVDLVVTSPPYNLIKKWWGGGVNSIHKDIEKKFSDDWYDDAIPEPEYQRQQAELLAECKRICRGSVCYNHKVRHAFKRAGRTFHPIEWTGASDLWCEIIWDRGPGPAVNCRRPVLADERVFVFGRPSVWNDTGESTIWRITPNREDFGHPCAFPVELPRRLIACFSDPGMIIFDPYAGSGTTAVAAILSGRKFIGCELSKEYFDRACARIREADRLKRSELPLVSAPVLKQPELFTTAL